RPEPVTDPHVATDKSVDASSVDRILAGLIREGMTDEQKVLAVFDWVRRAVYHGDGLKKHARDFHFLVNVSGHGSCVRQTRLIAVLLDRLGYRTQNWTRRGHHLMQVHYGGAWHCLDPHMTFYVYNRAKPRSIAGVEELRKDATLVTKAVEEKRACPGFLLCGDSPQTFAGKDGWKNYGEYPEGFEGKLQLDEPFGRLVLRRGETYVRSWWPGPYWYRKDFHKKDAGPYHGCSRKDRKDTVNWPLYEPHGWNTPRGSVTYRHWGAGRLEYAPDIAGGGWIDAVDGKPGVKTGRADGKPALVPAIDGGHGEVIFSVACPYVLTAGELELKTSSADVKAEISTDGGGNWRAITPGGILANVGKPFVDELQGVTTGYLLRLRIPPGGAVTSMKLVTHFQLNAYALPHLVPGENRVSVSARRFASPLTAEYRWEEGRDWKKKRSAKQTFTESGSFTIDVAGPKYPRMRELVLSVAP
ncbi:MAG: hypothetical protein ACYTGB_19060, partial [Planctomycetota bacterium]